MLATAAQSRTASESSERDQVTRLLTLVAGGDRAAFRALYDLTSPRLFAICLRVLRDRSVAEDALQDVYVRIWERARLFDAERGNGLAWVISIARNGAIDRVRAKGREIVVADSEALDVPDMASSRALEGTPEAMALWRCLDDLEERARQAIVLAYREGLTYEELSVALAVPVGTAKTWIRRAILKLRGCMDGDHEE